MRVGRIVGCVFLVACSSSPVEKNEVVEFECKNWPNQCYFKAQEKCWRGYTVLNKVETEETGGRYGRYKKYIVRVQCRH